MPADQSHINDNNSSHTEFVLHLPWWDKVIISVSDILLYKHGMFVFE